MVSETRATRTGYAAEQDYGRPHIVRKIVETRLGGGRRSAPTIPGIC
jgi:hypothetical protein